MEAGRVEVNKFEEKKVICNKCKRSEGDAERIDITNNTFMWRCVCGAIKEVIFSTNTLRVVEP